MKTVQEKELEETIDKLEQYSKERDALRNIIDMLDRPSNDMIGSLRLIESKVDKMKQKHQYLVQIISAADDKADSIVKLNNSISVMKKQRSEIQRLIDNEDDTNHTYPVVGLSSSGLGSRTSSPMDGSAITPFTMPNTRVKTPTSPFLSRHNNGKNPKAKMSSSPHKTPIRRNGVIDENELLTTIQEQNINDPTLVMPSHEAYDVEGPPIPAVLNLDNASHTGGFSSIENIGNYGIENSKTFDSDVSNNLFNSITRLGTPSNGNRGIQTTPDDQLPSSRKMSSSSRRVSNISTPDFDYSKTRTSEEYEKTFWRKLSQQSKILDNQAIYEYS